jgi:hypothetical protein
VQAKLAREEQVVDKVRPQWLLAGHHELPEHYYTTNGRKPTSLPSILIRSSAARMSTIHRSNVYY